MTGFSGPQGRRRASGLLLAPLLLALAACATGPADPEAAQIARLTGQGFAIVADGRGAGGPTALRYQGAPAGVIACRQGDSGGFAATDQAASLRGADGRTVARRGEVAAYVVVEPSGALHGLYVNSIVSSVSDPGGRVVARKLEKVTFAPDGTGRFPGGLTCRAAR